MVTTNDSRIRFINIEKGKVLLKMKGHRNEFYMNKASLSPSFEHAICASEDGAVYLWNNIEQSVREASKRGLLGNFLKTNNKLKEYEYFQVNQSSADDAALDNAQCFSDGSISDDDNVSSSQLSSNMQAPAHARYATSNNSCSATLG